MRKIVWGLLFLLVTGGLFAQDQLSVDVKDPVYRVIELGELKGALNRLSAVKPYTRSQIARYLERMKQKESLFNAGERKILDGFYERFNHAPDTMLYKKGYKKINFQAGGRFESNNSWNLNEVKKPETNNVFEFVVQGGIGEHLSYKGTVGFTQDEVNPEANAPYVYDKNWTSARYKQVTPLSLSWIMNQDLAASFVDDHAIVRFSKHRRDWGLGRGDLILSDSAISFPALELQGRFADVFNFSYLYGSLSYGDVENGIYAYNRQWEVNDKTGGENASGLTGGSLNTYQDGNPPSTHNRDYVLQKFEFFPTDWLSFSLTGCLVTPQGFNVGYLSPFLTTFLYQNSYGDYANSAIEVAMSAKLPKIGRIYGSLYTDEMTVYNPKNFFKDIDNMVALQGGIQAVIPGLPLSWITLQYTKVEPFVYAHMPGYNPDYFNPVDLSYTNDGVPLAAAMPPNSDDILVRFECLPMPRLTASFQYQLLRHGTNPYYDYDPSDPDKNNKVYGDFDRGIDYKNVGRKNYEKKDFLHDGIYDWNNILTLEGSYSFPGFPLKLKLGYTFVYTTWDANNSGVSAPDDRFQNILRLSVHISR